VLRLGLTWCQLQGKDSHGTTSEDAKDLAAAEPRRGIGCDLKWAR